MSGDSSSVQRPRGFKTLLVLGYVHQAVSIAVLGAALASFLAQGIFARFVPIVIGLLLAVASVIAIFGVASRKSPLALTWLRILLWVGVAKEPITGLWLMGRADADMGGFLVTMIAAEAVLIPVAIYWSRAAHSKYLSSLGGCLTN